MTEAFLIAAAGGGLLVGLLHFALLQRATAALLTGGPVLGLTLLRFAVTGAAAWAAVAAGPGPALALLAGFLVARHVSLRRFRRMS